MEASERRLRRGIAKRWVREQPSRPFPKELLRSHASGAPFRLPCYSEVQEGLQSFLNTSPYDPRASVRSTICMEVLATSTLI